MPYQYKIDLYSRFNLVPANPKATQVPNLLSKSALISTLRQAIIKKQKNCLDRCACYSCHH
ncbi:hypothetical protein DSUL_20034 [Desulfovibrionales bacterium]